MRFCRSQWVPMDVLHHVYKYENTLYFRAATHICALARMWPHGLHIIVCQVPEFSEPIARRVA